MQQRPNSIGTPVYYTTENQRPVSRVCYASTTQTMDNARNINSSLYPNIPILTHYGNTEFDPNARITKNNTYQRTAHDQNIYDTLQRLKAGESPENNKSTNDGENIYDEYNIDNNVPKENIVYDC
jgi:hypothetical protein